MPRSAAASKESWISVPIASVGGLLLSRLEQIEAASISRCATVLGEVQRALAKMGEQVRVETRPEFEY